MRVLVVGDPGDDDAGHVGERLRELGMQLVPLSRDALPSWAELAAGDLVLLLGSGGSVADPVLVQRVEAETALIRAALGDGVPVLGICYGAQVLAHALGGAVGVAPQSEIGWYTHQSLDPALCPSGPWLQFHGDTFTVPPSARLLGSSASGPQGLAWEGATPAGARVRALGWQFHPEVTPTVLASWLRTEGALVQRHGADVEVVAADTRRLGEQARQAAHQLTDTALDWLRVHEPAP